MVRPCRRVSQPTPPPTVSPATPVPETTPSGTASPCAWVAWLTSASVAPGWTRTIRRRGSTPTARSAPRSRTIPPSTVPWPATLWPPPRTASRSPCSRARATAGPMSPISLARTIARGLRSTMPFQTRRSFVVAGVTVHDQIAGDLLPHDAGDAGLVEADAHRVPPRGRIQLRAPPGRRHGGAAGRRRNLPAAQRGAVQTDYGRYAGHDRGQPVTWNGAPSWQQGMITRRWLALPPANPRDDQGRPGRPGRRPGPDGAAGGDGPVLRRSRRHVPGRAGPADQRGALFGPGRRPRAARMGRPATRGHGCVLVPVARGRPHPIALPERAVRRREPPAGRRREGPDAGRVRDGRPGWLQPGRVDHRRRQRRRQALYEMLGLPPRPSRSSTGWRTPAGDSRSRADRGRARAGDAGSWSSARSACSASPRGGAR